MSKQPTLIDVRKEAMETIEKLKAGQIDIKTAREISNLLNVVVNTAKTQVDFLNAIPQEVKKELTMDSLNMISDTFRDKDAELDRTLKQIEFKENHYEVNSSRVGGV